MFFRRYAYLDIFVVGLAASKEEAVKILQEIVEKMSKEEIWNPNVLFKKEDFKSRDRK